MLMFGNERHGLPCEIQAAADQRISIDMQQPVDSLNVSVAAGILLHYVCRLA
jgi:tRNA G18 (ribose-2'-O)-methylase SpoU